MSEPTIGDLANQAASGGAGGVYVYWGETYTGHYDPGRDAVRAGGTGHRVADRTTLADGVNRWYQLSDGERRAWAERSYKLGLIKDPNDTMSAYQVWAAAVEQAAKFYSYANKKITPYEAINYLAGGGAGLSGGGGGYKAGTTTSTGKQFQIPDPQAAEAAVKTIFQGAVGRDPTDGELKRYSSVLIAKAKASPTVTRTTTTTDTEGNQTSTSSSSGGYDAATTLKDPLQKTNEYGSYQAATTYMNALLGAIGNP